MKKGVKKQFTDFSSRHDRALNHCRAFTFVELLAVIAILAMLAALLIPALAGAKADNGRAVCQNNLKQIGIGYRLFEQDHNDMFPPAGFQGSANPGQISWDSYIHRYIGGTLDNVTLGDGVIENDLSPKVLVCPADPKRYVSWGIFQGDPLYGKRSYAMVGTMEYLQTDPYATTPAYYLNTSTRLGVGVYWQDTSYPADWDAKSFRTSVVKDPAGTILLVEQGENMNLAGDIWPCVSLGVDNIALGGYMLCQMWSAQPMVAQGAPNANLGKFLYQNHGNRFNYLFHDGHVETLATNATIGTGTLDAPKGMWTVTLGD
jgi:prepilin-type processing-associated H-X9-DG protein/prepilin-type N-terminal cleavage/methylation domain-containing protein